MKSCSVSKLENNLKSLCHSFKKSPTLESYFCNDDLCNVERNMCEDCYQLATEDLDVCRRISKPDNKGSESNENDTKIDTNDAKNVTKIDTNDAKNVTKIDTNQGCTITLYSTLLYTLLYLGYNGVIHNT